MITEKQAAAAFLLWEDRYREQPKNFYTDEQRARLNLASASEASAIYFMALLRELGYLDA